MVGYTSRPFRCNPISRPFFGGGFFGRSTSSGTFCKNGRHLVDGVCAAACPTGMIPTGMGRFGLGCTPLGTGCTCTDFDMIVAAFQPTALPGGRHRTPRCATIRAKLAYFRRCCFCFFWVQNGAHFRHTGRERLPRVQRRRHGVRRLPESQGGQ